MSLPGLETATAEEVRLLLRRTFLKLPDGEDHADAAMGVLRPVLEAKDSLILRLRERAREW